ncbi:hypothetical protein Sru01_54540 [Sphaerisporangium rufum]|uniref:CU044_5270 family protein n=1 Tax=Sphaerisporangium rufum TaxID=1381558 RepID=A0A919V366_9ACTN|nr:CU044_5270 family protein [Sphaerisporangium rufum]GII80472.1 hypothetical protein Sru01_54540 [Sphaerisporangium rufum]
MNDLQTFKNFHDGLPGPAPEVAARARERLAAEAVAEAGRAGGVPAPRRVPRPGRPAGRGRVALRAGVVAGLAAAATAGVIVVGGDDGSPLLGTPPADAADLLRQAAVAAAGEHPRPGADQFVYVDRKDVDYSFSVSRRGMSQYEQDVRREVWFPADPGKAVARSTYGEKRLISGRGDLPGLPAGTVEYQRAGQCHMDVLHVPSRDIGNLPTDPDRLLDRVRQNAEALVRTEEPALGETPPGGEQIDRRIQRTVASELVSLAENPFGSARTRAAVFGALAKLPGTTLVPGLADPAGRHGVGASIRYQGPDGPEREELIFEPGTYRFLGWRSWGEMEQEDGRSREVMRGGTAMMAVKIVDSMPAIPPENEAPTYC